MKSKSEVFSILPFTFVLNFTFSCLLNQVPELPIKILHPKIRTSKLGWRWEDWEWDFVD